MPSQTTIACFLSLLLQHHQQLDAMPVHQLDAPVQIIVEQASAGFDTGAAPGPNPTQQAKQWLLQHGIQSSLDQLVAYVDAISCTTAQQAQHVQHSSIHAQLHQLQAQAHQQAAQLKQQHVELEVLHLLQPSGAAGSRGSQLYQELTRRQQVATHGVMWLLNAGSAARLVWQQVCSLVSCSPALHHLSSTQQATICCAVAPSSCCRTTSICVVCC